MKKKIAMVICAVCLLTLTVSLMVGCGDDKAPGEKDPIIGTWIGTEKGDDHTRHFYADITYLEERDYVTTSGERGTQSIFMVNVKIVYTNGKSEVLTEQEARKNIKVEDHYNFDSDLSPLPHNYPEKQKYSYLFNLNEDKLTAAGEEDRLDTESGIILPKKVTYNFERTTFTLEQYKEQLKAS